MAHCPPCSRTIYRQPAVKPRDSYRLAESRFLPGQNVSLVHFSDNGVLYELQFVERKWQPGVATIGGMETPPSIRQVDETQRLGPVLGLDEYRAQLLQLGGGTLGTIVGHSVCTGAAMPGDHHRLGALLGRHWLRLEGESRSFSVVL